MTFYVFDVKPYLLAHFTSSHCLEISGSVQPCALISHVLMMSTNLCACAEKLFLSLYNTHFSKPKKLSSPS